MTSGKEVKTLIEGPSYEEKGPVIICRARHNELSCMQHYRLEQTAMQATDL